MVAGSYPLGRRIDCLQLADSWPLVVERLLCTAYCWPPIARRLKLTAMYRPPVTTGSLLVVGYYLLLTAYYWQPNTGSLLFGAFY